jgi:recombination protein RecA
VKKASPSATLVQAINGALKTDAIGLANDPRFQIQRVPIGILTLERITGGGFPRGRHVELFGDEATAKSYTAYRTMALAQERGEICALIDGEKVYDGEWFEHCGGDPNKLVYYRPRTGEELIEVLMLFAEGDSEVQNISVCTIDSVASILPKEELEKRPTDGDDRTASRARLMSRMLRRVTTVNDDTLFLWTNQIIDKIGGYGGTITPGGRALKFYASVRVEMKKEMKEKRKRKVYVKGKEVEKPVVVGQWVICRAEKQKTARPGQEGMFFFDYETRRIDREREIVTLGLQDGLIESHGKKLIYTDSTGHEWDGQEATFLRWLREEDDLAEELEWAIGENTRLIGEPPVDEDDADG